MKNLNGKYQGRLEKALEIFQKQYDKKFLCQLVSSQLDVDRLDYLNRDSFFTGVSEGVIGFERILKMLNVKDGKLVVEEKGLHSVANFLIARRLMYWQVYLHKTAVAAECMLIKVLQRARLLAMRGANLFATPNLHYFLYNAVTKGDFETNVHCLARFAELDDADIYTAIKVWTEANDVILSTLSRCLTQRYLFRIEITSQKPAQEAYEQLIEKAQSKYQVSREDASYLVTGGVIKNDGYQHGNEGMIQILMKDHSIQDILSISDHFSLEALMKAEKRYVLCYDRGLTERL